MTTHPHARTLTAAVHLERTAALVTQALDHLRYELAVQDGYPTMTMSDGAPTGNAELTSVERYANARISLRAQREQIYDDVEAIVSLVNSLAVVCDHTIGMRLPRYEVARCDGRGFEGAGALWVRYSHDPANGWHDPTCQEAADESGLCPACRVRERRWRTEHGLAPRYANAGADVVGVAA